MVIIAMLMIPFQAVVTPLYIVLNTLGLHNSLTGLALGYITYQLPFALFVMATPLPRSPWHSRRLLSWTARRWSACSARSCSPWCGPA